MPDPDNKDMILPDVVLSHRQWLAALAMQAILSNSESKVELSASDVARIAHAFADAMLKFEGLE